MAQGNDRTMLVAASGSDSDVQANTTGRSHRRRMIVGGTVGLGVALAVVLWRSYGRKDLATPAFKGDSLVSLATDAERECGHSASVCVSRSPLGSPDVFFTEDCLFGGVGCSASGQRCCRFCGAGDFWNIKCPTDAEKQRKKEAALDPVADKAADAAAREAALDPVADKAAAAAAREKIDRDKTVADKIAADKVDEDKMIANNTADDKAATDKAAAEKVGRDKKVADKIAADKVDENNMVANNTADDKAAHGKAAAEKATRDKNVADKIAADKVAEGKMIANNIAADEAATKYMVTNHTAVDKAAADKMVADKIAADNKADKAAADQVAAQRAALGR